MQTLARLRGQQQQLQRLSSISILNPQSSMVVNHSIIARSGSSAPMQPMGIHTEKAKAPRANKRAEKPSQTTRRTQQDNTLDTTLWKLGGSVEVVKRKRLNIWSVSRGERASEKMSSQIDRVEKPGRPSRHPLHPPTLRPAVARPRPAPRGATVGSLPSRRRPLAPFSPRAHTHTAPQICRRPSRPS